LNVCSRACEGDTEIVTRLRLEHAGFRVCVRSRDAGHLEWLDEFLTPWFARLDDVSSPEDEVVVSLRCDPDRGNRLAAFPRRPPTSFVAGFILDSRVVEHEVWHERGGERLTCDRDLDAFYRVSRRHPHVRILAGQSRVAARVASMRVVRELAMAHARRSGWLLLHAAAVEIGGRAIVIVGPKHAGKTTLLLQLLHAPGARFVANDRVLVHVAETPPRLLGLPSIVALRAGTLALFPRLEEQAVQSGYAFWETLVEARAAPGRQANARGVDVSPAQLCNLLSVDPSSGAPVGALIFPGLDSGRERRPLGIDVQRLDSDSVKARLDDNQFGGANGARSSEAFGVSQAAESTGVASTQALCSTLARTVPAFEYRRGTGPLAEPVVAAAFASLC
jgi:hypothetical protein